jgi:hypothetical protein
MDERGSKHRGTSDDHSSIVERLGAERVLDPQPMATLWQWRQALIEEYGTESPAMMMGIDAVMMSSSNLLRIQAWIGDVTRSIAHECFAEEALRVKLKRRYGPQIEGFAVEDHLRRLKEQLLPLCERVNRQRLQNLQALRWLQPGGVPVVAIGRAGQVNVAQQPVNLQRRNGRSAPPVDPR